MSTEMDRLVALHNVAVLRSARERLQAIVNTERPRTGEELNSLQAKAGRVMVEVERALAETEPGADRAGQQEKPVGQDLSSNTGDEVGTEGPPLPFFESALDDALEAYRRMALEFGPDYDVLLSTDGSAFLLEVAWEAGGASRFATWRRDSRPGAATTPTGSLPQGQVGCSAASRTRRALRRRRSHDALFCRCRCCTRPSECLGRPRDRLR